MGAMFVAVVLVVVVGGAAGAGCCCYYCYCSCGRLLVYVLVLLPIALDYNPKRVAGLRPGSDTAVMRCFKPGCSQNLFARKMQSGKYQLGACVSRDLRLVVDLI